MLDLLEQSRIEVVDRCDPFMRMRLGCDRDEPIISLGLAIFGLVRSRDACHPFLSSPCRAEASAKAGPLRQRTKSPWRLTSSLSTRPHSFFPHGC
jgi:hypothetical protein